MIVLALVSVLAAITARSFRQVVYSARAATIAADLRTAHIAAYQYQVESGRWPDEAGPGVVPPEIEDRAHGVRFRGRGYVIDWENVTDGDSAVLGLSVTAETPRMETAIAEKLQPGSGETSSQGNGRFFMNARASR